jgi:hypothetical protein
MGALQLRSGNCSRPVLYVCEASLPLQTHPPVRSDGFFCLIASVLQLLCLSLGLCLSLSLSLCLFPFFADHQPMSLCGRFLLFL